MLLFAVQSQFVVCLEMSMHDFCQDGLPSPNSVAPLAQGIWGGSLTRMSPLGSSTGEHRAERWGHVSRTPAPGAAHH